MIWFRTFIISVVFILLSSFAWCETFKVISFKGEVETSKDQKIWEIVTQGQVVKTGTWIRTGPKASATILLPNRTQTKISRNAEFQLNYQAKEKQTQVNLKLGKIWSKTNKKPAKISVKAPNAVASIRGTEWVVEVLADSSSSLAVLEGAISLEGGDGVTKQIDNGEVANVGSNGTISITKLLNPENYLQFIFKYEVEPFAYAPEDAGAGIDKTSRLSKVDPSDKTTACALDNSVTPKIFLESVQNRNPSCLVKIEPNILPNGKWKDWASLIKADANFALGDTKAGNSILEGIAPSSGKLYVEAKFDFSNGEYDSAIKKLELGVKDAFSKASFYSLLGEIQQAKGNPDSALVFYKKANEADPYWQKPLIKISQIEIANSNYDYALAVLKLSEKLAGKTNLLASGKAQYFSYRYQLEEARQEANVVLQSDPNQFDMLVALGIVELKAGNHQEALDFFVQALAIEPNYAKAYVFMAVAHLHANEVAQAITQLERAIKLDGKDPLPHVVASQIYASELESGKAIFHSREAIKRTTNKTSWGQLANDQQGGANVGRRFLEVGLPNHAREASQNTKNASWAGSYLFRAATAPSALERNSQYIRGFTLDSQTFGSQRNRPDVIARPGDYGYREIKIGLGEKNNDVALKIGTNGRRIEGNSEFSYLTDIGVFQTQRDAYFAADNTDTSTFGLGFFGIGWRDNFDRNRFLTANIVPFETSGTFPIEDTTTRIDFGASFRKDNSIFLNSLAAENGDAEISVNVSGGCSGVDSMKTSALEFGVGEVGVRLNKTELSWAAEGAYRQATSDYTVSDPTSSTACDDLTTSYSERVEKLENYEYDWVFSLGLKENKGSITREIRARGLLYDRDFTQSLSLDSVAQAGVTSNVSEIRIRPSIGISNLSNKLNYSLAIIQDYHPLRQASLQIDDIAGVPTKYEFMNSGGHINQASAHFKYQMSEKTRLFVNFDEFEIKNNPIYMIFREQWNADLLENFTLNKFNNPNTNRIYKPSSSFAAGRFKATTIKAESLLSDTLTMYSGIEFLDGKVVDHPGYDEAGVYGRVADVPESLVHVGFTKRYSNFLVAAIAYQMTGVVSTAYGTPYDKSGQKLNYTQPLAGGELGADLTHAYTTNSSNSNEYKITLTYRNYF